MQWFSRHWDRWILFSASKKHEYFCHSIAMELWNCTYFFKKRKRKLSKGKSRKVGKKSLKLDTFDLWGWNYNHCAITSKMLQKDILLIMPFVSYFSIHVSVRNYLCEGTGQMGAWEKHAVPCGLFLLRNPCSLWPLGLQLKSICQTKGWLMNFWMGHKKRAAKQLPKWGERRKEWLLTAENSSRSLTLLGNCRDSNGSVQKEQVSILNPIERRMIYYSGLMAKSAEYWLILGTFQFF